MGVQSGLFFLKQGIGLACISILRGLVQLPGKHTALYTNKYLLIKVEYQGVS